MGVLGRELHLREYNEFWSTVNTYNTLYSHGNFLFFFKLNTFLKLVLEKLESSQTWHEWNIENLRTKTWSQI